MKSNDAVMREAVRMLEHPEKVWLFFFHRLTSTEKLVAGLIHDALCYKEIADRLAITVPTVKFHIENISKKTGCRRPVEIALLCERANRCRPDLSLSIAILDRSQLAKCCRRIKKL